MCLCTCLNACLYTSVGTNGAGDYNLFVIPSQHELIMRAARGTGFETKLLCTVAAHLDSDSAEISAETTAAHPSADLSGSTSHNYVGHNYIGHSYLGHNHICHNYIGHNYVSRAVRLDEP